MKKLKNKDDAVLRVSRSNFNRLKDLMTVMALDRGEKVTLNILMEELLDSMESISGSEPRYLVGGQVFTDVAEARGEAILTAVREKAIPQWPKIAVIVGEDSGGS